MSRMMAPVNPGKLKMDFATTLAALVALAAFIITARILFIRPITGVADNGDFARVMNSTGLYYISDNPEDKYFGFVNRLYGAGYAIPFGGGYISTQLPLVMLAVSACKAMTGGGYFDIRFLSAIYLLIFIVAIFFTVRQTVKRMGIAGVIPALLIIPIFCDTGYISYFNSLYGEPVTYVSLLLMTSMAVSTAFGEGPASRAPAVSGHLRASRAGIGSGTTRPQILFCALFCMGLILFAGAKVQNTPAGLLGALLCAGIAVREGRPGGIREGREEEKEGSRRKGTLGGRQKEKGKGIEGKLDEDARQAASGETKGRKRTTIPEIANGTNTVNSPEKPAGKKTQEKRTTGIPARRIFIISAAVAAAVSLVCYAGVSREIKVCNKYQTVFYGILKDSPDPAGDLAELGLDPALAVLAGTNYFMEDYPLDIRTPEFKEMLFEKVGYTDVAGFYLRHPSRLLEKLEIAAENGFKLRQGFGNYEKYPGVRYKQTADVFCFWSNFKMNVLPHTLLFVFSFYAASVLVLLYEYRKADMPGTRFLTGFFGFIVLTGATQFVLPVLGDGEADLSKHLFLFNISFDLLFAAGLAYFSQKAAVAARYIAEYIRNKRLGSAPE